VILIGPEKLVSQLGQRGRLPIEVLPFGEALVRRELARLGLDFDRRVDERSSPVVTDNGNWILDAKLRPPLDARALEAAIGAIPGVLGTGFFLDMADAVIIGSGTDVEVRRAARG
jgi:ribose 5-phosphate isomerase A